MLGLTVIGWQRWHPPAPQLVANHDEVIMYALTTCGFCQVRARELTAAGIPFTEYFIDRDADRRTELQAKLQRAGLPPRQYGTPIMDVHGRLLPDNPSLEDIRRVLAEVES